MNWGRISPVFTRSQMHSRGYRDVNLSPPTGSPMPYNRSTLLMLSQLTSRLRRATRRTIDVPYMSMSARYADHVLGLAIRSDEPELRTLGAALRDEFFGPTGMFPGGRMLWSRDAFDDSAFEAIDGPRTIDFAPHPPQTVRETAGCA